MSTNRKFCPRNTRIYANKHDRNHLQERELRDHWRLLRGVQREGCGFLEPVYHECLEIEFEYQRIPAISKPSLTLSYRGRILKQTYEPDFVCFQKIIVELKAVSALTDEHRAQLLNYLHTTGFELGLLVNFGHYPKLEYERIAKTQRIKTKADPSDVSL